MIDRRKGIYRLTFDIHPANNHNQNTGNTYEIHLVQPYALDPTAAILQLNHYALKVHRLFS